MFISHGQASAQDKLDGWANLKDPAERRKAQNKVHQRSRRRRKAAQALLNLGSQQDVAQGHAEQGRRPESTSASPYGVLVPVAPAAQSLDLLREHSQILALSQRQSTALAIRHAAVGSPDEKRSPGPCRKQWLIPPTIPYINSTTDLSTIGPITFPISLDHRLITLIQYNVLRAMLINMTVLSLYDMMPEECGAAFALYCLPPPPHEVPPSLRPTLLQQTSPHPVWIGIAPDPAMRDNLIRNHGRFDEDDFCCDLSGGLYEGFDDIERRGMIAWSDPWSPDGWEVTEGFARKWGFLLKGCTQLALATNRWRAARGEEPLVFEI